MTNTTESADAAAGPTEPAGRGSRMSRVTVAIGILTAMALVAALFLARAFVVPLLLGILASYALRPVVNWFQARHIPGPVAAQTPIVLLLTYFLLASGTHFRRKLVQFVGPSLSRKKEAVRILAEIDVQVQRYLLAFAWLWVLPHRTGRVFALC